MTFFSVNDVHCTSPVLLLAFIILTEHMKNIAFDSCLCAHLVNNPAGDTHAIENGHIDNGGHSSIVDGLRAVRPHVRTLCQVDVAWRQTGRRQGRQRILLAFVTVFHQCDGHCIFVSVLRPVKANLLLFMIVFVNVKKTSRT